VPPRGRGRVWVSSSQVQILQCQTINIRVNDFHSATWITISTKPDKTDSNRFRRFKKTDQINLIFFEKSKTKKPCDKPEKLCDERDILVGLSFFIQILNFE
jgi:hypothetical protein